MAFVPKSDEMEDRGDCYAGSCPTGHDSKSGKSFTISKSSPVFHCFNCGIRGNYIHLIELIKFGASSSGKKGSPTFKDTLEFLADKYGISYSQEAKDSVFEIVEWIISDYADQMEKYNKGLVEKIRSKYGFTEEFIKSERIGYGYECPSKKAIDLWTREQLLSTGLFNISKKTSTGLFHIYHNRVVFPYQINGQIKYSTGRSTEAYPKSKYFKQYVRTEKRGYVSESIKNDILSCHNDYEYIVITEGVTDYFSLKMNNINVVSPTTTAFKKGDSSKIIEFLKKFKFVYIANDNDKNGAGQKGADRMSEMLIDVGINSYIISLPRNSYQEKMDVCEFIKLNSASKFLELKENATSYIDILLDRIPSDSNKEYILNNIDALIPKLSNLPDETIDIIIFDKIKNKFKLSAMRTLLNGVKKKVLDLKRVNMTTSTNSDIFDDELFDINMISSGQDFRNGVLYYTVSKPSQITDQKNVTRIVNLPFIVSSDNKITEIIDNQIISDGFALNKKISNELKFDTWSFKKCEYSVENYIKGNTSICPSELFSELKGFIDAHVYFQNDYESSFLSTALMTFPLYMIFDAIGYIQLWAEKRSGKTTVMEILQSLGFNAMLSSSMTDAAIFRSIEYYRPLLLMDEAEDLNPSQKSRESHKSEKLELLKSGYKKSGSATRCEGQNNAVVTFNNYSPKVFAGTKTIDSILLDRVIVIEMKRASEDIELQELISLKTTPLTTKLRNKIYCYAMQHCKDVEDIYMRGMDLHRDTLAENKITYRAKELWSPYLSVALLIDKYNPNLNVFNSLLIMANDEIVTKETFNNESKYLDIIELLYLWVRNIKNESDPEMSLLYEEDVFLRLGISKFFIKQVLKGDDNEDDFSFLNYEKLIKVLRRFKVIDKDCILKRHRIGSKRSQALILNKDKLLKSLMTYKKNHHEEVMDDIQKLKGIEDLEDLD